MGGFVQAVLSFPTVVFSPLLVVVIGYWIVVVVGGAGPDSEADGGDAGSGPGAESNLLKLGELRGRLSAAQVQRWAEVKAAYVRELALGGADDDPMTRAVGAVGLLADRVGDVREAITRLRP